MRHLLLALLLCSCAAEVEPQDVGVTLEPLFGLPSGSYCGGARKCITLHVYDLNVNRGADLPNHARAALAGGDPGVSFIGSGPPGSQDKMQVCWGNL